MTSDNVRMVREGVQAYIDGDAARALEMIHPDMVSARVAPLPDPQTYHGIEGVAQMYTDWTADFEDFEMWIGECFEAGHDHVVVELVQRGNRQGERGARRGAVLVRVHGRRWEDRPPGRLRLEGAGPQGSRPNQRNDAPPPVSIRSSPDRPRTRP